MAVVAARSWTRAATDSAEPGVRAVETSAPPGSPQALHRHDLAVLSVLLAITGIVLVLAVTVGSAPLA